MPQITFHTTIQYKRQTFKRGMTVEISVEDVEKLQPFGAVFVEERQMSTKRNKKRADN